MDAQTGYVAFLDVLGFSALVARPDATEALGRYIETVQDAAGAGLQYVVFSDSVILNSTTNDDAAFESIIRTCSDLFAVLLHRHIPIRGAIAHGSFIRSETASGTFIAGRPIVDAAGYEKAQDWIGIMLCPSTIEKQDALAAQSDLPPWSAIDRDFKIDRFRLSMLLQRNPSIPFRSTDGSNGSYDGYAVLPTGTGVTLATIENRLSAAIEDLDRLKSIAPDPRAQTKYRSTTNWLRSVTSSMGNITRRLSQLEMGRK